MLAVEPIPVIPIAIFFGFLLDFLLGDPRKIPHPVCGIGWLCQKGEQLLRQAIPQRERLAGSLLVVFVLLITGFIAFGLCFLAKLFSVWLYLFVQTVMCWQALAARSLKKESLKVYHQVEKGSLTGARQAVAMIVGRDTQNLSMEQVIKAAVETVAENLSDGVIAPLFFMALGGGPLALCYKAVNTLDSMIGYKNDRYLRFGTTAAKLDDLVNWLPARLAAGLMILAAWFTGYDAKEALRIYRRDRYCHASPNSAHTEAVCAGALGVQLAGNAYYFGKLYTKPTIGDSKRPVCGEDIPSANVLMYGTSWLGWALALLVSSSIFII